MSPAANRSSLFLRLYRRCSVVLCLVGCLLPARLGAYPTEVKGNITLATSLSGIALTPNRRFLAALSATDNSVYIIDASLFKLIDTVTLPETPKAIAAASDSTAFYVVTGVANGLYSITLADSTGNKPDGGFNETLVDGLNVSTGFDDVAVDDNLVYLLDDNGTKIYAFDTANGVLASLTSNPLLLSFTAREIRTLPELSRLFVLGSQGSFSMFNSDTFNQIDFTQDLAALSGSGSPNFSGIAAGISSSGHNLAFAFNAIASGETFAMNLGANGSSIAQLAVATVGNQPVSGELYKNHLFVANSNANSVSIIDVNDYFEGGGVTPVGTISLDGSPVRRGFAADDGSDGYIYLSLGDLKQIALIHENPKLTVTAPPPTPVTASTFQFGFTSDESGDYSVRLNNADTGGAITTASGTLLKNGQAVKDEEELVTVSTDDFVEGKNLVHVFLTGAKGTGRIGFEVDLQTPPGAPKEFELDFGDQKIFVRFKSVGGDIDRYRIYLGTSPTALTGTIGVKSPSIAPHPGSSGTTVTKILQPLSNGQKIYVQVAAVTKAGLEGKKTAILSATPEQTIGFLGLFGESGGCSIGRGNNGIAQLLLLILSVATIFGLRRRRRSELFLPLLLLAFSTVASAGEWVEPGEVEPVEEPTPIETPDTPLPARNALLFSLGVSWWLPQLDSVDRFYGGEANEIYSMRFGAPFAIPTGSIEPALETGILLESSRLIGVSSGLTSGEESDLTLVPVRFVLTYIVDPPHDWVVAPFIEGGWGATYFSIREQGQSVDGWRHNIQAGGGIRLFIDRYVRDTTSFREILSVQSAYLDLTFTYEQAFSDDPFQTDGYLLSPRLGVQF